jgi:glucoamylase
VTIAARRRASAGMLAMTLLLGSYLAPRFWIESHPALDTSAPGIRLPGFAADLPGTATPAGITDSGSPQIRSPGSWLAGGRIPKVPELGGSTMVQDALRDLETLSLPYGVPVAGWAPAWRYVWPRDSAFAASALARTGHISEARRILNFLIAAQAPSGKFQARYRPDGSGPPDDRGLQLDGSGWAVWALGQVATQLPSADDRRQLVADFGLLLDRSVDAILVSIGNGSSLPPPSADYWETPERRVTLATCSVLLAGLRSAERLYGVAGDPRQFVVELVADRFEQTVLGAFAADGFPRHLGGPARSVDLGVTFMLSPFAATGEPAALDAWRRSPVFMRRPAGGLAPGGSWRRDGISWTPTVATYAMAAACHGPRAGAVDSLRWLDQHRTAAGSLPEKVLANGQPASVAPLAWTAAAVVITADELERGCADSRAPLVVG